LKYKGKRLQALPLEARTGPKKNPSVVGVLGSQAIDRAINEQDRRTLWKVVALHRTKNLANFESKFHKNIKKLKNLRQDLQKKAI
jgi:hypothetical protein